MPLNYIKIDKIQVKDDFEVSDLYRIRVMPLNYIEIDKIQVKDDFEVSDLYCIRVMPLYYAYGHNIVIFSNK